MFTARYGLGLYIKSTCYVMHQQFNIQQLYAVPTLYLCVLYLRVYRVTYTRCRIDTINYPDDGHMAARNM